MAGRGRGLTLPAWMTSGGLQPITPTEVASSAPAAAAPPAPAPAPERNYTANKITAPAAAPSVPAMNFHSMPPPRPQQQNYAAFPSGPQSMGAHQGMQFPGPGGFPGMGNGFVPPMHMHNPAAGGFAPPPFGMNPNGGYPPVGQFGGQMPPGPAGGGLRGGVPPPAPPMPRLPPGAAPAAIDPANDVSCWAEHESEAGLKYWYNRVTLVSTYDKPFCLKTPEERSIPACAWKEYTSSDDKKYYSNGKESSWIMPEEFRVWRERMDAVEKKKAEQAVAQQVAEAERVAQLKSGKQQARSAATSSSSAGAASADGAGNAAPAIQYGSAAEAAEAFKDLLAEMKVSTIAKMKEVQDLCQHDARWEALKSQGEKKQALAEYQTKRLKQEKENQKLKARKQRDAFLLMLAENTDIDARTRWKDAVAILQDDARYKNIEDARDREDLFQEFVLELEKKEKEDKRRARDEAVEAFNRVLKEFAAEGKISRKSIWADCKKVFVDVICKAEFRAMDDSDFRRAFQSYTAELEEEWRAAEKRRKLDQERGVAACQLELRALLEGLVREGQVKVDSRWKECVELEAVRGSAVLAKLRQHFPMEEDRDGSALTAACRQVFDAVQNKAYDQYRLDRRLLKDLLSKHSWRVKHDSTFADFKAFALKVGRVREAEEGAGADAEASKVLVEPLAAGRQAEDGEEVDDAPSEQLRAMMVERPAALAQIFAELLKKAQTDYEEEQQWVRKVERKFNSVLAENFYLPEHAAIPWDDAKKALQRRSVYDELGKSDRRRLFAEHMAALAAGVKIPERAAEPVLAERDEKSRHRRSRSNSHSNRAAPRGNSEARRDRADRGDRDRDRAHSKDRARRSSRERGGSSSRGDRGRERDPRDPRDSRDEREDEDRRKRARTDAAQK